MPNTQFEKLRELAVKRNITVITARQPPRPGETCVERPTLTISLGWDSFTGMRKNNVIHSVKIDMRADANTKFHITVDKDMQKMVLTPTPQAG